MPGRPGPRPRDQRGSTAVEFALVVPVLLVLFLGIAEFGRAFQVQGTLTAAAREGVREVVLRGTPAQARAVVRTATVSLDPAVTDAQIAITPASCPVTGGTDVRLTVTYPMPFLTGFFGDGLELTGTGVMRCNG